MVILLLVIDLNAGLDIDGQLETLDKRLKSLQDLDLHIYHFQTE